MIEISCGETLTGSPKLSDRGRGWGFSAARRAGPGRGPKVRWIFLNNTKIYIKSMLLIIAICRMWRPLVDMTY
jgi:hypothetical protein